VFVTDRHTGLFPCEDFFEVIHFIEHRSGEFSKISWTLGRFNLRDQFAESFRFSARPAACDQAPAALDDPSCPQWAAFD
jgi:hypothetical protein